VYLLQLYEIGLIGGDLLEDQEKDEVQRVAKDEHLEFGEIRYIFHCGRLVKKEIVKRIEIKEN